MIEQNLFNPKICKTPKVPYFVQYISDEEIRDEKYFNIIKPIIKNYGELSKNDWALHKQLIKEGVNPNEIAKIIRNDEIEKLQEISSQNNFNFNQIIEPSIYERCSFINEEYVSLIDYSAFFGSIKCFKYLLLNNANLYITGNYAIAGGNLEIFHLCEQSNSSLPYGSYEIAIRFHRNDIFHYVYEKKIHKIYLEELGKECVYYHNYEILSFLIGEGMKISDSLIHLSIRVDNIFLTKYFLNKVKQIQKDV